MKKLLTFMCCFCGVTAIFMSCAPMMRSNGVCDNPEMATQSWLCQAATKQGMQLEDFGDILIDTETIGLLSNNLEAEKVIAWCEEITRLLKLTDRVKTYRDLIQFVKMSAQDRAILHLISRRLEIFTSDLDISRVDLDFLLIAVGRIENTAKAFIKG
jgi:hypothetical protein